MSVVPERLSPLRLDISVGEEVYRRSAAGLVRDDPVRRVFLVQRLISSFDVAHLLGMAEGVRERCMDLGDRDIVARRDLFGRVVSLDVAVVTSSLPVTAGLPTALHAAGVGTSGLHTDECRKCHAPGTPILWEIRRYPVVLCRYPTRSLDGRPSMSAVGIPILSDCPDMGVDIPPRSVWGMLTIDIERRGVSDARPPETVGFSP